MNADLVAAKLEKVSGPDHQGWYTALCPFHDDKKKPNLRFRETGFRCMACGKAGPIRILAEKLGIEREEIASSGLTIAELSHNKKVPEDFLRSLGVSDGFAGSWSNRRPCVDIPYMNEAGELASIQKRLSISQQPRFIWRRGDHPLPYGLWRLSDAKSQGRIVIVEGASDCWMLWQHGIPALGLPGASTWKPDYGRYLDGLTAYLWVEPDAGGQTFSREITASLPDVRIISAPEGIKDPSELYLTDADGFAERFNCLMNEAKPASELLTKSASEEASQLTNTIRTLAENPNLIEILKNAITANGYAGDPRPALCAYIAITSRSLDRPLNIVFVALSASGKNASIDHVLPFFPDDAYHIVRASSPLALVYSNQAFTHKMVILWEADSLPEEGPSASAIRSLMSDQRLEYQVVERAASGRQQVRVIEKEGPTGLITTSTRPLREQASTRMLTISIPDTHEQTKAVLQAIARKESITREDRDFKIWVDFQRWLELAGNKEVSVPFATLLADKINLDAVRVRRDFSQVLTVIKVFAFLHQAQRSIDEHGRIIATLDDYRLTHWLLEEIFATSTTGGLTPAVKETVNAVVTLYTPDNPVTVQQLAEHLNLAKSTISYRVNRAIEGGWLVNRSNQRGVPAKLEPGMKMPDKTSLPDPGDMSLCVNPPENDSNTRTLPQNEAILASKDGPEVFESRFEQSLEHPFEQSLDHQFEHRFEQSFEHSPEADFVAENPVSAGTVRVFESKQEGLTHIDHKTSKEPDDWMTQEWRRISIPEWRSVLHESVEKKDARREEYARWMLRDVLEDPEYEEKA